MRPMKNTKDLEKN